MQRGPDSCEYRAFSGEFSGVFNFYDATSQTQRAVQISQIDADFRRYL